MAQNNGSYIIDAMPVPLIVTETGGYQYVDEGMLEGESTAPPPWFQAFNENPPPQSLLIAC